MNYNRDAEEVVLSALLNDKNAPAMVMSILKPEMFHFAENQMIFQAMKELYQQSFGIDMVTVAEKTMKKGVDMSYLVDLTSRVSTAVHIEYHASIVKEKYILRELGSYGWDIAEKAKRGEDGVKEILEEAERGIFRLSNEGTKKEVQSIADVTAMGLKRLDDAMKQGDGMTGVPCGLESVDKITGGWQRSDLIILAARPGQGKTSLALDFSLGAAALDIPVAVFSLEMSNGQLINRLISRKARVDGHRIMRGLVRDDEYTDIISAAESISALPVFIDDTPGLSILEMKSKCRKLKMEHDIRFIVVDYIQLMTGDGENRTNEVGSISRGLKLIAKELDVPVVALSQLSRAVETRGGNKRPQLSDLRESGSIEQDADLVMFLYRPQYYNILEDEDGNDLRGVAELIFAKHRNGALCTEKLKFEAQFTTFTELKDDFPSTQFPAKNQVLSKGEGEVPF